jgi:hypothetical protein
MGFIPVFAVAALALLVWVGRRPSRLSFGGRLASALFSALAAVGAVVSGLRGGWAASLVLVGLSAWLGYKARLTYRAATASVDQGMSAEEARRVLGVDATADRSAIDRAYRNRMRGSHPDQGGTDALAAQVNAARDRLIGRPKPRAG